MKIINNTLLEVTQSDIINEELTIKEGIVEIAGSVAYGKNIKRVIFPKSLKKIGNLAFANNQIDELVLPEGLTILGEEVFANNHITNVRIPKNVETLGLGTFLNNQIKYLVIESESLKQLGPFVIDGNQILELHILSDIEVHSLITRSSGKNINILRFKEIEIRDLNGISKANLVDGKLMLLCNRDLEYVIIGADGKIQRIKIDDLKKIVQEETIQQQNFSSKFRPDLMMDWIQIYTSPSGFIDKEMLSKIGYEIMASLPATRENANLLKQGITFYNQLKSTLNLIPSVHESFFKMCYSLGLFEGDMDNIRQNRMLISHMIEGGVVNYENIDSIFRHIDLKHSYNKNASALMIEAMLQNANALSSNNPTYSIKNKELHRIYNEFNAMKSYIEKAYKMQIRSINAQIRNVLANGLGDKELDRLKEQLTLKIYAMKKLGLKEVDYYLNNHVFQIRPGNESLKEVVPYVRGITQKAFNKIQDLYQAAQGVEKEIPATRDEMIHGYTYEWLPNGSLDHITIPYQFGLCSVLDNIGEDIFVQTMLNPYVNTLVIRNKNNQIVAKATAYFNKEKKYILFNNVEAPTNIKKLEQDEQEKIKLAVKRAARDQAKALREHQGMDVEIRLGMQTDLFKQDDLPVIKDPHLFLPNYPYYAYKADANNPDYGQGILLMPDIEEKKR